MGSQTTQVTPFIAVVRNEPAVSLRYAYRYFGKVPHTFLMFSKKIL